MAFKKCFSFCFVICACFSVFSQNGGTDYAAAFNSPITLPYLKINQTTLGAGNNIQNPTGFNSSYTTGPDWFYVFTPTSNGSITLRLMYKTSASGVYPSVSVWSGQPGASTLVTSKTALGNNASSNAVDGLTSQQLGLIEVSFNVTKNSSYSVMLDNDGLLNPLGIDYDISIYLTPMQEACTNIGFDLNTKSGWTTTQGIAYEGNIGEPYPVYFPYSSSAYNSSTSNHKLSSTLSLLDPIAGFTTTNPGSGNSLRLGDGIGTGNKGASIEQQFKVEASNSLFIYYYAVVLEDEGHDKHQQPMFKIDALDCDGNKISCGEYLVVASGSVPGFIKADSLKMVEYFKTIDPTKLVTPVYYKPWTPVFLDLSAYIGKCITIRFTALDCSHGGHFGYAYVDAECRSMEIQGSSSLCAGQSLTLIAPSGAASYEWKIKNSTLVLGTNNTLLISPSEETEYECNIKSYMNCQSKIYKKVTPIPAPDITSSSNAVSYCQFEKKKLLADLPSSSINPWLSLNTAIATIDALGNLTALKPGKDTLIYTALNGCKDSLIIAVNGKPEIVGSDSLCSKVSSQFTASNPSIASSWSSSDTSVLSISPFSGSVSLIAKGAVSIFFQDQFGCRDTLDVVTQISSELFLRDTIVCNSFNLPVIKGVNITNEKYYDFPKSSLNSTEQIGAVSSSKSLYVYDKTNFCSDEKMINVTVNQSISLPSFLSTSACDSFLLVPRPPGKYFTLTNGGGEEILANSYVKNTRTIFLFDVSSTICKNERDALITINNTPVLPDFRDTVVCDFYILPLLTKGDYYSGSNKSGVKLVTGDSIKTTGKIYVYTESGSNPICFKELNFNVSVLKTPVLQSFSDVSVCDSFALKPLSLGAYFSLPSKSGQKLIAGTYLKTNQKVYVYKDTSNFGKTCLAETSFFLKLNNTPSITVVLDQEVCDFYVLPQLTGGEYYTESMKMGVKYNALDTIKNGTRLYVYAESKTPSLNCVAEKSFFIKVNKTPKIPSISDTIVCDRYVVPLLNNVSYFSMINKGGISILPGDTIYTNREIVAYAESKTTPNCFVNENYLVTINKTPLLPDFKDTSVCDEYNLPNLMEGSYYSGKNKTGTSFSIFQKFTSDQLVYVYVELTSFPACKQEKSFDVIVSKTPLINTLNDTAVCDKFTVPIISNGIFYSGPLKSGVKFLQGDSVLTTQQLYVYSEASSNSSCFNEKNFKVVVHQKPPLQVFSAVEKCDLFVLNPLFNASYFSGSSKTGIQYYPGDTIKSSQKVFVYAESNTVPNCVNEKSFSIQLYSTPLLESLSSGSFCDSVRVPPLTKGDFYTLPLQGGVKLEAGSKLVKTTDLYAYIASNTPLNCIDEKKITFLIHNTPYINTPKEDTVCMLYKLAKLTGLNLSGNQSYYSDSIFTAAYKIEGELKKTAKIWVYDANAHCYFKNSFSIRIIETPVLTFFEDKIEGCSPLNISFTNTTVGGIDSLMWVFGDGDSLLVVGKNKIKHTYSKPNPSCYDVVMKSYNVGCLNLLSKPKRICVFPKPTAFFKSDLKEVSFYNTPVSFYNESSSDVVKYNWDFGFHNTSSLKNVTYNMPNEPGMYPVRLVVTNSYGCTDFYTDSIKVKDDFLYYVPNTFTPDDDLINPIFKPIIESTFDPSSYIFLIFNRWGDVVFESRNVEHGWDGYFKGKDCPNGTYSWRIQVKDIINKNIHFINGHVNLLR